MKGEIEGMKAIKNCCRCLQPFRGRGVYWELDSTDNSKQWCQIN